MPEHDHTGLSAAFIISLDFELHWGVRDLVRPDDAYVSNLHGARTAVPRMLDLFAEHNIAATWATVGFLMARSREEVETFNPRVRPRYVDANLDPYTEPTGESETDDPLHFASSLVDSIAATPRQEIATHTYSHYYCLETGADLESFRQDLQSSIAIARSRGIETRSIVLPRNQWEPSFSQVLLEAGITGYRGPQRGWMYLPIPESDQSLPRRVARMADTHLPVTSWKGTAWKDLKDPSGLINIPATAFLRPVDRRNAINQLRMRRLKHAISRTAKSGGVFHLWWHPHNFGADLDSNLEFLRNILRHVRMMGEQHGMRSLSMREVADEIMRTPALEGGSEVHA